MRHSMAATTEGQWKNWSEMVSAECAICSKHRADRCRVRCHEWDKRHEEKPFTDAPYLHPFNLPRYYALLLRALRFARAHGQILLWYCWEDKPYKGVDESLRGEQLEARRQNWPKDSDDKTAGIMGLLPLVREMPMRCNTGGSPSIPVPRKSTGLFYGSCSLGRRFSVQASRYVRVTVGYRKGSSKISEIFDKIPVHRCRYPHITPELIVKRVTS